MFTPSIAGALTRAAKIDMLHQHTQGNAALSRRARALADVLLCEGKLSSRTTNAELLARLGNGWYEEKISRAFKDLHRHGYGNRKPGANTPGRQGFLPPLWTWYTNTMSIVDISVAECLPVISSTEFDTSIAVVVCGNNPYWQAMKQGAIDMDAAELRDNIYFSIYMQNLEIARGTKRGRFWRVIEDILSSEAAQRGVLPHAKVLARIRYTPVQPGAVGSQDELDAYYREWVEENGGKICGGWTE